jgi:putative transposase
VATGAHTFFSEQDYVLYRDLLAESYAATGVAVWAWCLMPDHVHLILVPSDADGLRRATAQEIASIDDPSPPKC